MAARRFYRVAALAVLAGWFYFYRQFRIEKQAVLAELRQKSQLASLPQGLLEYARVGQGTPLLVFHGGGGGYEQGLLFQHVIDTERHELIAVSRPGARQSPLSTGASFEAQADAGRALLDALGIERAVVIGLSAGGMATLQFGLRHPDVCRGIVLVSGVTPLVTTFKPPEYLVIILEAIMRLEFLHWAIVRTAAQSIVTLTQGAVPVDEVRNPHSQMLLQAVMTGMFPSGDWREGIISDIRSVRAMPDFPLETMQVPARFIHGTRDTIIPYPVASETVKRIPNSELITIEDGTHLLVATHHAEVGPAIEAFVADLPA